MPWAPGQSGNPGGRSRKLAELAIKISEMDEQYRARLDDIAQHGDPRNAIAAIKLLWAYAHGNPTTVISGPDGGPVVFSQGLDLAKLSPDQLEQLRSIIRTAR